MEVTVRRRMAGWLLALGMAAAGARAAGNGIVLIGSSTAAGVGASTYDSSFAGRYAKYLTGLKPAWKLTNLAVGGYTTYTLMPTGTKVPAGRSAPDTARNITKALALKPTALLISILTNDILDGYPTSETYANFDTLSAVAARAGVPTWFTTPVPRSAFNATQRKLLLELRDRILTRYAPRVINFYDSLGDAEGNYLPGLNSGDGIHTNDRGHAILFRRVVAANLTGVVVALAGPDRRNTDVAGPALVLSAQGGNLTIGGPGGTFDLRGRFAGPALGPRPGR